MPILERQLTPPIFLALDVDSDAEANRLVQATKGFVGGYKLGPRLCLRYGQDFIREIAAEAPVFVDNKYFDIPSTMEAALRATFDAGASFATIHAGCGLETLKHLAKLEVELNQKRYFRILCVTVLTSYESGKLPKHWREQTIAEHVQSMAQEVFASGLSGLVCSPEEAKLLRTSFPNSYLVTPGIRMQSNSDDQKRVMGPSEALKAGASALVVGRPIVAAADPKRAAQEFFNACKNMVG